MRGRRGNNKRKAGQMNKRPKRHHLMSLGPLVSFFFLYHYFITNKLFKVLTSTVDDDKHPEPLLCAAADEPCEHEQ